MLTGSTSVMRCGGVKWWATSQGMYSSYSIRSAQLFLSTTENRRLQLPDEGGTIYGFSLFIVDLNNVVVLLRAGRTAL